VQDLRSYQPVHHLSTTAQGGLALVQFGALVLVQVYATLGLGRYLKSKLPASLFDSSWGFGLVTHCAGFLVAVALMASLKPFFSGSFGFSLPKGRSFVWPALWIGAVFGILMLGVDHYSELLARRPPVGPYSTSLGNMIPWLIIQGSVVGLTEETVFRSLFQGYLMTRIKAQVRVGRYKLSFAGVLAAVLFSLAHADAFWHAPLIAALGQQIYAIGFGLLCAYLFEQSGSILAPIVAHNAGDFVEWSCRFALRAVWS